MMVQLLVMMEGSCNILVGPQQIHRNL